MYFGGWHYYRIALCLPRSAGCVGQVANNTAFLVHTLQSLFFTGLDLKTEQSLSFRLTVDCLPHSDLVGMYAHENVVNLTRYALPLEEFVRQEEERSARLAATLLPQYQANGELVPFA